MFAANADEIDPRVRPLYAHQVAKKRKIMAVSGQKSEMWQ